MVVLTRLAAAAALVALLVQAPPAVAAEVAEEYPLKAAFLLSFTRFVEWPPTAFVDPVEPLGLCVLGHDPFGDALERVLAGESVAGRPVVPRRLAMPEGEELDAVDLAGCHLLFLSREEDPAVLRRLPAETAERILTVGESIEFLEGGGLLRFRRRGSRIVIEVNVEALARTRLSLSSKLLRVAHLVRPEVVRPEVER